MGDADVVGEVVTGGAAVGQNGSTLLLNGFSSVCSCCLASSWLSAGMPSLTLSCATGVSSSIFVPLSRSTVDRSKPAISPGMP